MALVRARILRRDVSEYGAPVGRIMDGSPSKSTKAGSDPGGAFDNKRRAMSRSGYVDDYADNWQMIKWRGMVASATRGKRGQKLLVDLLAALDAMPEKALVANELETPDGQVCALGALGKARGMDMSKIDPCEPGEVSAAFGIAEPLAQEIVYMNDEYISSKQWDDAAKQYVDTSAEERWEQMRAWVALQIKSPVSQGMS